MSLDYLDFTHTVGPVTEGGDVTPVKPNTNSDYASLERKFLDMDSRHTGCDTMAISDISGTVDIGVPLLPVDPPCRASSLEDQTLCSQSDRRPVSDIEDFNLFSAQVDPVKSIDIATDDIEAQASLVLSSYSPLHAKFSWFSRDIARTESRIHIRTYGVLYSLLTVIVITGLGFLGWHYAMMATSC